MSKNGVCALDNTSTSHGEAFGVDADAPTVARLAKAAAVTSKTAVAGALAEAVAVPSLPAVVVAAR